MKTITKHKTVIKVKGGASFTKASREAAILSLKENVEVEFNFSGHIYSVLPWDIEDRIRLTKQLIEN